MDPNTKHLLSLWGLALFFGSLTLVGLVSAVLRGDYTVVIVVALVLAFIGTRLWYTRRQALLLFQDATPDRIIAFYRRTSAKAPKGAASVAYMSSLAAAFYGQFERARQELAAISWDALPPMYQGFEKYALSVLALLEERDYPKALALAREARDLCQVSRAFPGGGRSQIAVQAIIDVNDLLWGEDTAEIIARLKHACKALPGTGPALPAWALAVHYHRKGQHEAATQYASLVRSLVPHCVPLNQIT